MAPYQGATSWCWCCGPGSCIPGCICCTQSGSKQAMRKQQLRPADLEEMDDLLLDLFPALQRREHPRGLGGPRGRG